MTSRQVRYIARFVALAGMLCGAGRAEAGAQVITDSARVAIAAPPRAAAPGPKEPTRLWLTGGLAAGQSGPAQSNGHDQFKGLSGEAAAGVMLSPRGIVGVDATYWHRDTPIGSSKSAFVVLTLLGYPFDSFMNKLYFQAGVGVGRASLPVSQATFNSSRLSITEPALLVGLGYDIPVACPLWIGPFAQSYTTFGGRRIPQQENPNSFGSANAVLFQIGLALRFYHAGPSGACTERPDITLR